VQALSKAQENTAARGDDLSNLFQDRAEGYLQYMRHGKAICDGWEWSLPNVH